MDGLSESDACRLVVKAIFDLLRTMTNAYYRDNLIGDHVSDLIIGSAVILGQAERHPMTASDISIYTILAE